MMGRAVRRHGRTSATGLRLEASSKRVQPWWMDMHRMQMACLAAIVMGMAACGPDLTSPSLVAGTYVARSIDGVLFPRSLNGVRWQADTLFLSPSGTFKRLEVSGLELEDGTVQLTPKLRRGLFFVRGSRLTLQFGCASGRDDQAVCLPERTGVFEGGRLTLRHGDSHLDYEAVVGQ